MFDPDAHMPKINRGMVYLGACLIAGIRLARERQVNVRGFRPARPSRSRSIWRMKFTTGCFRGCRSECRKTEDNEGRVVTLSVATRPWPFHRFPRNKGGCCYRYAADMRRYGERPAKFLGTIAARAERDRAGSEFATTFPLLLGPSSGSEPQHHSSLVRPVFVRRKGLLGQPVQIRRLARPLTPKFRFTVTDRHILHHKSDGKVRREVSFSA